MNRKTTKLSAFTLIELLTVIAIIALLAAILFPTFSRARENARRSSCQSNLKQIATAISQYTQDYDERYPNADASTGTVANPGWAIQIQPYLKSEQVFQCPSERGPLPTAATIEARGIEPGFTDYYLNYNVGTLALAAVQFPANSILNGEGTSGVAPAGGADFWRQNEDPAGRGRHFEGANYAFADGHVKWLRPEAVLRGNVSDCGPGNPNVPTGSNATFCTG